MARTNLTEMNFQLLNEAHAAGEQLQQNVGNAEWEIHPKKGIKGPSGNALSQ